MTKSVKRGPGKKNREQRRAAQREREAATNAALGSLVGRERSRSPCTPPRDRETTDSLLEANLDLYSLEQEIQSRENDEVLQDLLTKEEIKEEEEDPVSDISPPRASGNFEPASSSGHQAVLRTKAEPLQPTRPPSRWVGACVPPVLPPRGPPPPYDPPPARRNFKAESAEDYHAVPPPRSLSECVESLRVQLTLAPKVQRTQVILSPGPNAGPVLTPGPNAGPVLTPGPTATKSSSAAEVLARWPKYKPQSVSHKAVRKASGYTEPSTEPSQ